MPSRADRERLRKEMEERKKSLPPQPQQGTIFGDDGIDKTIASKEVTEPKKGEKADIVKMPDAPAPEPVKKKGTEPSVKKESTAKEKKERPISKKNVSAPAGSSKWIEKMRDVLELYDGDKSLVRVVGSEEDIMFWKKQSRKNGIPQQDLLAMFMLDLIKDIEDGVVTEDSEDVLPYQKALRDMATPVSAFLPKKLIEKIKASAAELCLKQTGIYAYGLMRSHKKGIK